MEIDSRNTAWVLTSAALVLLMTPGLALFYGGVARSKSVLHMLMMSFSALGIVSVLWVLYGYAIAFGATNGRVFGFSSGLLGLDDLAPDRVTAGLPDLAFIGFQLMFAVLTVALISGAVADRMKFGAWVVFTALWRRSSTSRSRTGCSTSGSCRTTARSQVARAAGSCSGSVPSTSRAAPSSRSERWASAWWQAVPALWPSRSSTVWATTTRSTSSVSTSWVVSSGPS